MGATGWNYFVPYQADIEAALQKLRALVFERGEYGMTHGIRPDALASMPPAVRKSVEKLRELEGQRLGGASKRFNTIDELLEAAAEDGTHSILDIQCTATRPDFGVAWRAPYDVVHRKYGTAHPNRAQIEACAEPLCEAVELENWQAVFVLVYDHGRPVEIYFDGASGD